MEKIYIGIDKKSLCFCSESFKMCLPYTTTAAFIFLHCYIDITSFK